MLSFSSVECFANQKQCMGVWKPECFSVGRHGSIQNSTSVGAMCQFSILLVYRLHSLFGQLYRDIYNFSWLKQ